MNTPRTAARCALILGLTVLLAIMAGCTQWADSSLPQTTVFPRSDYGRMIQSLYELIFWMAVVVFVGVEGFLLWAIIRYRRRDDRLPRQVHGNTGLEVTWTVIPSVVLLVIAVPSISTIFASDAVPQTSNLQRIKVVGHQWWWEFQYTDLGISTANELHLVVNQTASFQLNSADVIHSFWFPLMGGKMDVFPARDNHMWFTPQQTGDYHGQCVEFCGTQHANMRMRLIVESQSDFQAWAQRQRTDAVQPTSAEARQGAEVFQKGICIACHTIRGTAARGTIGPV